MKKKNEAHPSFTSGINNDQKRHVKQSWLLNGKSEAVNRTDNTMAKRQTDACTSVYKTL
jgi:hypothetical protein